MSITGRTLWVQVCFVTTVFFMLVSHIQPPPPSSAFIFSRQDQRNFRARWKYLAGGEAHVDPCLFDGLSDAVK